MDKERYVSIRDIWGQPKTTVPMKKNDETISNLRGVEDRVMEGEEIDAKKIEIEVIIEY